MVSISALGELKASEPIDNSLYVESRGFRLPTAGQYAVKTGEITEASFGATQAGHLKVKLDPIEIEGGEFDGFKIRFTNLSAKSYERTLKQGGKEVRVTTSQVAQYLKAHGIDGAIPTDPQEIANLVAKTSNKTATAYCDWEVRYQGQTLVKGMKNFPLKSDGTHQSYISSINEVDPAVRDNINYPTDPQTGDNLRLRANLVVRGWEAPRA